MQKISVESYIYIQIYLVEVLHIEIFLIKLKEKNFGQSEILKNIENCGNSV